MWKSNQNSEIRSKWRPWIGIVIVMICGFGMLLFVWNLNGRQIMKEVNFFLQQTSENIDGKLEYINSVIYALRDNTAFMDGLKDQKMYLETDEAEQRFRETVNIGKMSNNVGSLPILEAVWLFQGREQSVHTFYYALSDTEIQKRDKHAADVLGCFINSGKTDYYYAVDLAGSIYLVKLLYDDDMKARGTLIFQMRNEMLETLLGSIEEYKESIWCIYDRQGEKIANSRKRLSAKELLDLKNRFIYEVYAGKIQDKSYIIYTKELPMNLMITLAIPKTEVLGLLYQTAKVYILLIIVTMTVLAVFVRYLLTQVYQKQYTLKEMELKYVQTQMNPHFMYNIMNSIAIEARLDGNEEIFQKLNSFTELIRAKIFRGNADKVKIGQELEYIRYYLYLQNSRFGNRIQYEIQIESQELLDCMVPKLCLQLIVENAVVHGLEPKIGEGKVRVNIYQSGENEICLDTIDDGVGFGKEGEISLPLVFEQEDDAHNHVGLNNVYRFLRLIYGERYGLSITSYKDKGTMVRMRIPYEMGKKEG